MHILTSSCTFLTSICAFLTSSCIFLTSEYAGEGVEIAEIITFAYQDYFTYQAWGKICLARSRYYSVQIIEGLLYIHMFMYLYTYTYTCHLYTYTIIIIIRIHYTDGHINYTRTHGQMHYTIGRVSIIL